jgi:hypothetical protein
VYIGLKTSDIAGAGTNCYIHGTLNFCSGGSEGPWNLDNDGDDNEQGDYDVYAVEINSIQKIASLRLSVQKSDDDAPKWHLAYVRISDWDGGHWEGDQWVEAIYYGEYNNWIDPPAGSWLHVDVPVSKIQ